MKFIRGSQLTTLDAEMLLRFLEQRLTPEERGRLMAELPGAYNRWMGAPIVMVVRCGAGCPGHIDRDRTG